MIRKIYIHICPYKSNKKKEGNTKLNICNLKNTSLLDYLRTLHNIVKCDTYASTNNCWFRRVIIYVCTDIDNKYAAKRSVHRFYNNRLL